MISGKVLIVDDEIVVRQGLCEAVTSNFPQWRVAGEAANGAEALEKIKKLEPHLVLTDIRMPIMDGMDLARNIYQYDRDIDVIILTGYKDFEYAQAAIRYGVREFLLKPCPEEELAKVLQSTYDLLLERTEKRENELLEKQSIVENMVRSLILRLPYDVHVFDEAEHEYNRKHLWFIKIPSYFPETKSYRPDDISFLQYSLCNIMSELISIHSLKAINTPIFYDMFALFLEPDESICDFIEQFKEVSRRQLGIAIEAADAGVVQQMKRLPAALEGFLQGRGETVRKSKANSITTHASMEPFAVNQMRIKSLQNRIMVKIQIGQPEDLKESLKSIIHLMKGLSPSDVRQDALALAVALHKIMRREFHSDQEEFDLIPQIEGLYRFENLEEVIDWIGKRSEEFQLDYMKWLQNSNQNTVERSIRYLEENYMNRCSLTEVAEFVHLSPSYFSNLFKKETGESFINYVTKVRMDKAKVLLSNTGMKIFEIAHSVGYDDPNYFTAVFKHTQKSAPGEFRKLCLKER